uniref:Uncharacterized protein n=1 Tax=Arundo donax TaxID=35708 RepID=A0A0A9GQW2_ARUDO
MCLIISSLKRVYGCAHTHARSVVLYVSVYWRFVSPNLFSKMCVWMRTHMCI